MSSNKELGSSKELVDMFKFNVVNFTCVIIQVQEKDAYPLELDETPNTIDFYIVPFI